MDNDFATGYALGADSNGGGNCNGNGMWGDGGWWAIILFAMIFGWGNGGWGGGFGGGNGSGVQGALTRGDLCNEFSFNDLQSGVRNVNDSVNVGFANLNSTICHQQYDTAMLVNGINQNLMNGFHGIDNAVCTLGYQTQAGFNSLGNQISSCCCDLRTGQMQTQNMMERGFCDNNYNQATNTNAIIQNAHNDTDRILARLDALESARKDETIADLRSKLAACGDQTTAQYIINQLTGVISPRAVPAYPAASPCGLGNWSSNAVAGGWYGNNGYNNNCGCNSGCCGCNG